MIFYKNLKVKEEIEREDSLKLLHRNIMIEKEYLNSLNNKLEQLLKKTIPLPSCKLPQLIIVDIFNLSIVFELKFHPLIYPFILTIYLPETEYILLLCVNDVIFELVESPQSTIKL